MAISKNANLKNDKRSKLDILYDFMKKYKNNEKKMQWTHTSMGDPFGSYNIPDDIYPQFIKLYVDAIMAGHKPFITERHKEIGPIVIDLDFVQSKENDKRYYNEKTIQNIIRIYDNIIKQFLDIDDCIRDAYVTEKKSPTLRAGEYHDGIHIMYPYICTKPQLQLIMRDEFIKKAEEHKIFKNIPLVNSIEDVFDKKVIHNTGWLLYGSRKSVSSQVYELTHVYRCTHKNVYDIKILDTDFTKSYFQYLVNVTSIRRFFDDKDLTSLSEKIDPREINDKFNKIRDKIIKDTGHEKEMTFDGFNFIKAVSDEQFVEAKNLVKLFSNIRAYDYYSWYQVGKCLHNIDYRLLEDWIEFSKKCPKKFKEGECEKIWRKMKPSNYTMATLHFFALQDNPEQYLKMKEEKLSTLIKDGLEASHNTIAKLLMEKYKFTYRCASIKHNTWYEYKNHRWIEIDSAYSLRNLISDELVTEYAKRQSYLYDLSKEKNGYEKEQCINEAIRISNVIKQLRNSTFKNGVIRECADIAHDPSFLKNLDENNYLICFENGIYDLEAKQFRAGCPDDYISLCTGYKYVEYNPNDEYTKDIDNFIKKVQVDKVMRDYLLTLLSTCLSGAISEENFYVFTGSGANGKSKLMELLKYTLGDYFKPMDIRLLTEKRSSSSSASPEVADKKGIRLCPFDEPKANDEINTGFMKIFTGGDTITARALFKEQIYFKPQFKPFLLCNHLPSIKSDDEGTWRRIRVIPFPAKFITQLNTTKKIKNEGLGPNQFWADLSLSEKLPNWKQTFMGILINYYHKYKESGLIHPKLVTKHSKEYRKKCDIYQDFIGDYLEKTNDDKDKITISALHEGMRSWYRTNYDGKCPAMKDLRSYLQQRSESYDGKMDSILSYKIKTSNMNTINSLASLD
uniref:SF3 helicase domain-containing protein n=1 Tax=viral metagenome TaxID=1070528 RepID=A0A6C0LT98_9ZZZZ